MSQLYLVAFKEENYGTEPKENYALRELLKQHCSYCIPAGKTEVWGPYTPKQSLAEICWLTQEIGFISLDYSELINNLRAAYRKKSMDMNHRGGVNILRMTKKNVSQDVGEKNMETRKGLAVSTADFGF